MKARLLTSFLLAELLLALASSAMASTTLYVNGVSGSDSNPCTSGTTACKTIGHAISLAASGDTIVVAAAAYSENLAIGINLTITGSGSKTTIIDGGGIHTVVTISSAAARVSLSRVTIQNGSGGDINNAGTLTVSNSVIRGNTATRGTGSTTSGGGIYNNGMLTINISTISGNNASFNGCGYCGALGGGIFNNSNLTITNSTVSGNVATISGTCRTCSAAGGGVWNTSSGTLAISNSTFSDNAAAAMAESGSPTEAQGGGLDNLGAVTITNSTFSGNTAKGGSLFSRGGGIVNGGTLTISSSTFSENSASSYGGGIFNNTTATIQNSIVADSPSGGNCWGVMTSKGYNLSSDGTCKFDSAGDLNNTDPQLGPLQNNSGPTQTIALPDSSPAVDAGNQSGCTDSQGNLLTTDQRGKPRPGKYKHDRRCDMGAYERQRD